MERNKGNVLLQVMTLGVNLVKKVALLQCFQTLVVHEVKVEGLHSYIFVVFF